MRLLLLNIINTNIKAFTESKYEYVIAVLLFVIFIYFFFIYFFFHF